MSNGNALAPAAALVAGSLLASLLFAEPPTTQPEDAYAGYAYVMPKAERQALARKINELRLGDDVKHVIAVLGSPDNDFEGGANTLMPRLHRRRCLAYDVARFKRGLVNIRKDQGLDLWFDAYGRLEIVDSELFPSVACRETADAMDAGSEPGWWIPKWVPYRRWVFKQMGLPLPPLRIPSSQPSQAR